MKVRVYSQLSVNLGYVSLCQLMCWNRLFDGQMTFLLLLMFNELKPVHLLSIWGWREYKSQWQRKTKGKNKVKQKKCSSFTLHQRPLCWKTKIIKRLLHQRCFLDHFEIKLENMILSFYTKLSSCSFSAAVIKSSVHTVPRNYFIQKKIWLTFSNLSVLIQMSVVINVIWIMFLQCILFLP